MTAARQVGPVNRAIDLARKYHGEETDLVGQRYERHVLRVMERVWEEARLWPLFDTVKPEEFEHMQVVAALHDALRQAPFLDLRKERLAEIGAAFNNDVCLALNTLTQTDHEFYLDYIRRICAVEGRPGAMLRFIKLQDILDNEIPLRYAPAAEERIKTLYPEAKRLLLEQLEQDERDEQEQNSGDGGTGGAEFGNKGSDEATVADTVAIALAESDAGAGNDGANVENLPPSDGGEDNRSLLYLFDMFQERR